MEYINFCKKKFKKIKKRENSTINKIKCNNDTIEEHTSEINALHEQIDILKEYIRNAERKIEDLKYDMKCDYEYLQERININQKAIGDKSGLNNEYQI